MQAAEFESHAPFTHLLPASRALHWGPAQNTMCGAGPHTQTAWLTHTTWRASCETTSNICAHAQKTDCKHHALHLASLQAS